MSTLSTDPIEEPDVTAQDEEPVAQETPPKAAEFPAWLLSVIAFGVGFLFVLLLQDGFGLFSPPPYLPAELFGREIADWLRLGASNFAFPVVGGFVVMLIASHKGKVPGRKTCEISGYFMKGLLVKKRTLSWDRNTFCRGWLLTGVTGSGKTESGINVMFHSVCQNEAGVVRPGFESSRLGKAAADYSAKFEESLRPIDERIEELTLRFKRLRAKKAEADQDRLTKELQGEEDPQGTSDKLAEQVDAMEREIIDAELSVAEKRFSYTRKMMEIEKHKYSVPPWGGLCVDEKGEWYQTARGILRTYGRTHHLCLLMTRPSWAPSNWKPSSRYNLLSDTRIPPATYAQAIMATAAGVEGAGKGGGNEDFFTTQARTHIEKAIALDRSVRDYITRTGHKPSTTPPPVPEIDDKGKPVPPFVEPETHTIPNLSHCHKLLTNQGYLKRYAGKYLELALKNPAMWSELLMVCEHFLGSQYLKQPPDQLGGVVGTIHNSLYYFTEPEVAEAFCSDNTFAFDEIDRGLILCVAMPQKLATHRRYISTILKLLYFQHSLRRYDNRDIGEKEFWNLLILWQDEAQRFFQKEDGNVDVLRAAFATTILATQMKGALYAVMEERVAKVTVGNLRNRAIFAAADADCAKDSADFIGKHEKEKVSRSVGKGGSSKSISKEVSHLIAEHELRKLPKFTAVVHHADGKWEKIFVPPLTIDGKIPRWLPDAVKDQPLSTRMIVSWVMFAQRWFKK